MVGYLPQLRCSQKKIISNPYNITYGCLARSMKESIHEPVYRQQLETGKEKSAQNKAYRIHSAPAFPEAKPHNCARIFFSLSSLIRREISFPSPVTIVISEKLIFFM